MPAGSFTADFTAISERARQKAEQEHAGGGAGLLGA
jgi:hypothetical protein